VSEFTSGFWRIRSDPHYMPNPKLYVDSEVGPVAIVEGDSAEQQWANAQLLSACPELLAACQLILREEDGPHDDRPDEAIFAEWDAIIAAARAAVAKALGGAT